MPLVKIIKGNDVYCSEGIIIVKELTTNELIDLDTDGMWLYNINYEAGNII